MPSEHRASVDVATYSLSEVAPDLRAELDAWQAAQFGHIYKWAPAEWYAAAHIAGELAGTLLVVTRRIDVGGESVSVAGIGGVVTKSQYRKKGVASAMMHSAAELMRDRLNVEFGFLICREQIAPVYEKAGWIRVSGPTRFWQPSGVTTYPNETMILRLGRREWPGGAIDLRGLPW